MFVDQRANPAQQLALVAMVNELSKGLVGTIVQVSAAPVSFADHGSEINVAAGQVALDVNKHLTHDPTCGAMQWFHPLAAVTAECLPSLNAAKAPALINNTMPAMAPAMMSFTLLRRGDEGEPNGR